MTAVAEARRGAEIRQLQNQVENCLREIGRGVCGANGAYDSYLASRQETLKVEAARLQAVIDELNSLAGKALEDRFNPAPPESGEDYEPLTLRDALRGQATAGQVVYDHATGSFI